MRALAVAAGLAAAALAPGARVGIGFVIVTALVLATVARSRPLGADQALLLALSLCLASTAALLDADWVITIDLLAAWTLAAIAVSGRSIDAVIAPAAALRRLPSLLPPVTSRYAGVLRGATLGGALVVPFAALFWTADAVFAALGSSVPLPSADTLAWRIATFVLTLLAALGLALARRTESKRPFRISAGVEPAEWAIALAGLNVLFAVFVGVQLTVLFAGGDYVLRTADLTYAEYARRGFWQLLAAAALTLTVVGAARAFAAAHSRRDTVLLRTLLGGLCTMTLVVVVSALHRLDAYADAFGLTRSRLAAETAALGLLGLFALVLAALAHERLRACFGTIALLGAAVGLLAFSLSNPDGRVAQRNVARWLDTGRMDVRYLQTLSADAVPALARLPEATRALVLPPYAARLAGGEPATAANLSRHRARTLLRETRSTPPRPTRRPSVPSPDEGGRAHRARGRVTR